MLRVRRRDARNPEVEHLHPLAASRLGEQHHVVRLEVAMHDVGGVGGAQRERCLARHLEHPGERQRAASHELPEALAVHVLEHEIERAIGELAEVAGGNHIRVLDARSGDRLALEARHHLTHARELRVQHLERDGLAHVDVLGTVNGTHAAGPEQALDAIPTGDHRPRREARGAGSRRRVTLRRIHSTHESTPSPLRCRAGGSRL